MLPAQQWPVPLTSMRGQTLCHPTLILISQQLVWVLALKYIFRRVYNSKLLRWHQPFLGAVWVLPALPSKCCGSHSDKLTFVFFTRIVVLDFLANKKHQRTGRSVVCLHKFLQSVWITKVLIPVFSFHWNFFRLLWWEHFRSQWKQIGS